MHVGLWRDSLINSKFFNVIFAKYKILILIEESFMRIFSKEFVVSAYEEEIINWIIDLEILSIFNDIKRDFYESW